MEILAVDENQSFNSFYTDLMKKMANVMGIPPNIALSKYDTSFSASRIAWQRHIETYRANLSVREFHMFPNEQNSIAGLA